MKRSVSILAMTAMLGSGLAMAGAAMAQQPANPAPARPTAPMPQYTAADATAVLNARVTALKTVIAMTPEQEKLWPPVEAAVKEFAKLRIDRANARMNAPKDDSSQQKPDDPVARLRDRADNMATTAIALKKIADAADPLYKTLDDGQKRRLAVLTHMDGGFGGRGGWRHRDSERGMGIDRGSDRERDYDRNRYDRDGGPDRGGPERL